MIWKLYYGDGATYQGPPELAPKQNVQVVVYNHYEHGRQMTYGCDFYWWDYEEEVWYGGEIFGLWDQLIKPGKHIVLFGRTIETNKFRDLLRRAMQEDL